MYSCISRLTYVLKVTRGTYISPPDTIRLGGTQVSWADSLQVLGLTWYLPVTRNFMLLIKCGIELWVRVVEKEEKKMVV